MASFELHNPEIVCGQGTDLGCGQNVIIPDVPTEKPIPGQTRASWLADQWDQVAPILAARGWVVVKNELGGRFALCKHCSIKHAPQAAPLPTFSIRPKCVMCGHRSAGVRFCDGVTRPCKCGARDHVHRTCERCGYQWAELPRSQSDERASKPGRDPQAGSGAEPDRNPDHGTEEPQAVAEAV